MAKIVITVKNSDGVVLSGAKVAYELPGIGVPEKTTDASGQVTISDLTAGEGYHVTATMAGYKEASGEIAALEDSTNSIVLTLEPESAAASDTAEQETVQEKPADVVSTAVEAASAVVEASGVTEAVNQAVTAAVTNPTTTVSEDWDTIKAAAKTALSSFKTTVSADTVTTADLTAATSLVQEQVLKPVEDWLNLMITKRNKVAGNWLKALGYDLNMAPAYVFKLYVAKEIAAGMATLKAKLDKALSDNIQ